MDNRIKKLKLPREDEDYFTKQFEKHENIKLFDKYVTGDQIKKIMEYDLLYMFCYMYKNSLYKSEEQFINYVQNMLGIEKFKDLLSEFSVSNDQFYVPYSTHLIHFLSDKKASLIVFKFLFNAINKLVLSNWNEKDTSTYTNCVLLDVAYFQIIAKKLYLNIDYKGMLKQYFGNTVGCYEDLVDRLFDANEDNPDWDDEIDLIFLDDLFDNHDNKPFGKLMGCEVESIIDKMNMMYSKYYVLENFNGIYYIESKTDIKYYDRALIRGFDCYFCMAANKVDEYIFVFQNETRLSDITKDTDKLSEFEHDLYYKDLELGNNSSLVYIIYILDQQSDNIPIQMIESNKTYGRKYVFTIEEATTFINGIISDANFNEEVVSPVEEWENILQKYHLTGCLTESYAAKKVNSYLDGNYFDSDYAEDMYDSVTTSSVPKVKWIKSLNTKGFRDFCFDDVDMDFGQINLLYGANGSGKTSVLEGIEYALTSDVRRVKDFKIKMPSENYPKLQVYDLEAGVHTFTPSYSKANNKEIEKVWYGVPIGRTKSNLNDNFNRFNSFDSEAAYKFIHSNTNDSASFSTMFGNLMFGESIVGYEKKWKRFKLAFEDKYTELRQLVNDAKFNKSHYENELKAFDTENNDEIEELLDSLQYDNIEDLPSTSFERYTQLFGYLEIQKKYVDSIKESFDCKCSEFSELSKYIDSELEKVTELQDEKQTKLDQIANLKEENENLNYKNSDIKEFIDLYEHNASIYSTALRNWNIVDSVLNDTKSIKLLEDITEELGNIDTDLEYIKKIELYPSVVQFLQLSSYRDLGTVKRLRNEKLLTKLKQQLLSLESNYEIEKNKYGAQEQQTIEMKKLGKELIHDSSCPLCGHKYSSIEEITSIIDSLEVSGGAIEEIIDEIQAVKNQIEELELAIKHDDLIKTAKKELEDLTDIPCIEDAGSNYKVISKYFNSKKDKENRKESIEEQLIALRNKGFSEDNIEACHDFKKYDSTYIKYLNDSNGYDNFSDYVTNLRDNEILKRDNKQAAYDNNINILESNYKKENLINSEIERIEAKLNSINIDCIHQLESAYDKLTDKFSFDPDDYVDDWIEEFYELYDLVELEYKKISNNEILQFQREELRKANTIIEVETPRVQRCLEATVAFEKMKSLSSYVENSIKSNIQQIDKLFRWMHHSGEFIQLGIDDLGIYAIRSINKEKVRTYEMSTGQRATIAMSVMFALHIAAPDAPHFLLLDEPLATMDDTQVLNVLDILKSMAEKGTQIFFTTANGVMIDLFKKCFYNTDLDYKEFFFVKHVNMPSTITVSSVNKTKSIDELTLDDLTLDFHQFAQIREILKKNQKKLVTEEEEVESVSKAFGVKSSLNDDSDDGFATQLTKDEISFLNELIENDFFSIRELLDKTKRFGNYKSLVEQINSKAIDYYGESIINSDDELPYIEEDYLDEVIQITEC